MYKSTTLSIYIVKYGNHIVCVPKDDDTRFYGNDTNIHFRRKIVDFEPLNFGLFDDEIILFPATV